MAQAGIDNTTCLEALSPRLVDAAVAQAAVTASRFGSDREAVRIAMDLDELLHKSQTLRGTLSLLGRMNREHSAGL